MLLEPTYSSILPPASPRHDRPNVYHNAYPCLDKDKQGQLGKNRDAAAFAEILSALQDHGSRLGSMLFNYALTEDSEPIQFDHHHIRKGDVIVTVTRPPLHDEEEGNKKYVPQSGTELERRIFDAVLRWLSICSRSHLRLHDRVVAAWEARVRRECQQAVAETPADFIVSQNCDARLKSWSALAPDSRPHYLKHSRNYRSLGFFLHLPRFEGLECRLIVSFGMGSLENLIWNHIVRTRCDRWFDEPVFALAEMDLNGIPANPQTLHFADEIPVRLLMELAADDPLLCRAEPERVAGRKAA